MVVAKSTVPGVEIGFFAGENVKSEHDLRRAAPPECLIARCTARKTASFDPLTAEKCSWDICIIGRYDLEHYVKLGHVASLVVIPGCKTQSLFPCVVSHTLTSTGDTI